MGDKTKLDGIEALANVTNTANVTAAGALMESEITNLAQLKAFDSSEYATDAQGDKADTALQAANNLSDLNDAPTARTNLGLVIGTDVQAFDAQLADVAGLAVTDGNIIVGDGTNFVAESGAIARASLGLDDMSTQASSSVSITGGSIAGITDLALQMEVLELQLLLLQERI